METTCNTACGGGRPRRRSSWAFLALLVSLCLAAFPAPANAIPAEDEPCPLEEAPTPLGPSGSRWEPRPAFNWTPVPGATSYQLSILDTADNPVLQTEVEDTFYLPGRDLPSLVDLRWRVRAMNACGMGPPSESVEFYIEPCPPEEGPVALSPSGSVHEFFPTLLWSAVRGATSYTAYVLDAEGNVVLRKANITSTGVVAFPRLPLGVDLQWKVKAESACGPSPYSETVFFRLDLVPVEYCPLTEAPVAYGPSGRITESRPTFSWSAVPGASDYTLYVLGPNEELVVDRRFTAATSFTPFFELPTGVELRWKVKAENVCGPGPYAGSVGFRVEPCPTEIPVPQGPSGTVTGTRRPAFSWSTVPGATSYTLTVLSAGENPVMQVNTPETTLTPESDLPAGDLLRWTVRAESPCGPGPESSESVFHLRDEASVSLVGTGSRALESAGGVEVSVQVTTSDGGPTATAISVPYTTRDGTATAARDYGATAGSVSFPQGAPSGTTRRVVVPILEDREGEPSEAFELQLTGASGATVGATSRHSVTIEDNDPQPPRNDAVFVSQGVPPTMVAGRQYPVTVTMRNTGTTTWTDPARHALGAQSPSLPPYTWGVGRVPPPVPIAPGATSTFQFLVTAPTTPGTYPFRWMMIQETVDWFGPFTPLLTIAVTSPPPEPVVWANPVNVSVTGNSLTKREPIGWNGGAVSTKRLTGDGYVELTASQRGTHRFFGLGNGDSNQDYTDLEFGLEFADTGPVLIYEGGALRGYFGHYSQGDRFRVAAESGRVRYYRNGELLYESTVIPTFPLVVDTTLFEPGATLNDVMISGSWG